MLGIASLYFNNNNLTFGRDALDIAFNRIISKTGV